MHPFGSFCWEFIVWSTITDIQATYIYIYIALVLNKQSVAARVYFVHLFADPSPCVRDPNDPAN